MLGSSYQVLSDCPHCRVEAAVVELMDPLHPACHLGVPAEVRCRMCGWAVVAEPEPFVPKLALGSNRCPACNKPLGGEHCDYEPRTTEKAPASFREPDTARRLLERWAREEGDADVEVFCQANMGLSVEAVVTQVVAGEVVSTTFDVIAFLFPQAGAATERQIEIVDRAPVDVAQPLPPPTPRETAPLDPRTPARVLVSVMVADGELRDGERTFIARFLEAEGLEPFAEEDLRVWRPYELGPVAPELRERLIEACVHLMHLDRERDGSEWKVVRTFSRAWGVPDAQVEEWDRQYDARYATAMTMLWRTLNKLVRIH